MAQAGSRVETVITADASQFKRELAQATTVATQSAARIKSTYERVGLSLRGAIAGALAGLTVGAFAGLVKGSIDAADKLQDLSQRTGLAVETLGGLGLSARQSGTDLDQVAKGAGRLASQLAEAAGGSVQAAETLRRAGVSLQAIKTADVGRALADMADKFELSRDGALKAAAANTVFGNRLGASMIPLLNEGGEALRRNIEYFKRYSGVSDETTRRADEFNDTLEKVKLLSGAFANNLAAVLLPSLQRLADLWVENKEKGDGFKDTADRLGGFLRALAKMAALTALSFENLGDAIGARAAQAERLLNLDFAGVAAIGKAREEEMERRRKGLQELFDAIDGKGAKALTPPKPKRGGRDDIEPPVSKDAKDFARKVLDGQIKELEHFVAEEREVLQSRLQFLQDYYQHDELSIEQYFERRRAATVDALHATQDAYDEEIRLLRERQQKADPQERADLENKISDVVAKRTKVERDAALSSVQSFIDQGRAAQAFRRQIEELSNRLEEMRGNSVDAGLQRFDLENEQVRRRLELQRNAGDEVSSRQASIGLRILDQTRDQIRFQLQLNKAQEDFGLIVAGVEIAQQRAAIQYRAGAITELEALAQTSEANRAKIEDLKQVAAAAEKAARELGDQRALLAVEQLKVKIEELALATDLVAQKFNDVFADNFTNALDELVAGTKKASDVLKDLIRGIARDIGHIANKNISEQLFGKDGPLSFLGKGLAGLFGGDKGRGGISVPGIAGGTFTFGGAAAEEIAQSAATAGLTSLGAASTTTAATLVTADAALVSLSTAATAASAALASVSASSGVNAASNIISGIDFGGFDFGGYIGTFAKGGSPPVGKASLVGERGPELFIPKQSGTIIPNDVLNARRARSVAVNIGTINVPPGTSRASAAQIATQTARHVGKTASRRLA
jgi:hypothetical protein